MIPSGYKEDTVYSAIPTDGSGDLSFTRASNGTRVNSAGLVEVVAWNLAEQSETFNNSPWFPNNATITANSTTAPNGTTTADTFTLTPGTFAGVYQAVNGVSNNYTISVYAKYVSGDKYLYFLSPLNSQGAKVWFDIQNGTVSNQLSGFTGTIENAGNGWYKCSMYNTTQAVLDYIQIYVSTTNSNTTLSNNSVSYFWGAQVNLGTAKPYFPTTDRLNVPRLTYQNGGGGCPSLLLEKQSTNLVSYSEDFSNASWLNNGTIVVNQAISPDGTQNADLFYATTGSVKRVYKTATVTSSTAYSVSIFAKASGKNFIFITDIDNSNEIWFNLSNGTFTSPIVGTATMVDYGNGWYKCSYITTSTTTTGYAYVGVSDTSGSFTFTANGTDGVYLWGAQLEASSYPTSYIPTTSSSATRVADACFKTGISSLIGQTEGVIYIDVLASAQNVAGLTYGFFYLFGDATNNIQLYYISGILYIYVVASSSVVINSSTSQTITANTRYKIAMAYKSGQYALYVNGAQLLVNTASAVPAMSQFNFNATGFGALAAETPNNYNEFVLFPTRLTNAELASLTTI